ncbi:phosphatase SPAC5H10.03 [Apiospora kogelbergensis]|uniref:Phosphatase SPAC5H10.03 n=1 Tax=Apiospora kogelbergensis TaxID=1337665 RepID=A0AAW0QV04_9PEZI
MAPTIYLVRHGEAEHNAACDLSIPDPSLTNKGGEQCRDLASSFPYKDRIALVVASPMRRTLQTAHWAFIAAAPGEEEKEKHLRHNILALGELQECSVFPCDTGRPVEELAAECGDLLDLSRVEPHWNSKRLLYAGTQSAIRERAQRAREILRELAAALAGIEGGDDAYIVVVSHGTLIQYLIERPDAIRKQFGNCEWRSYKFVDLYGTDPTTAGLVETNESFYRWNGPLNMRSPQEADDLVAAEKCRQ